MTGVEQIFAELERLGVTIRANGDILQAKPLSLINDDLKARIREVKPAILEALRNRGSCLTNTGKGNRPVTCSPSCYEVEPGKWIHRPRAGCTTVMRESRPQQVRVTCWHCRGEKQCGCIACRTSVGGGPWGCVVCRASGEVLTWVN